MATPGRGDQEPRSRLVALGIGAAALTGLLVVEIANASVMLAPMGCGLPFSFGMQF